METIEELARHAVDSHAVPGISYSLFGPEENSITIRGFQGSGVDQLPLTVNSLYDLASLTKVVATTTRVLQLIISGRLHVDSMIGDYVPDFAHPHLTVGTLMLHRSGLPPDIEDAHSMNRQQLVQAVLTAPYNQTPNTTTQYSDLNYILLGWLVAAIDGPLAAAVDRHICQPLAMNDTTYNPAAAPQNFVPTERQAARGGVIRGQVHDYKAFLLDGVSGHAGLFSTLNDLTRFTRVLAGAVDNAALPPEFFTYLANTDIGGRTFGWRRWSHEEQYWHTGFTGTSIAFDRRTQRGFVCLTNRVYPTRGNRQFLAIRRAMLEEFFGAPSLWK